MNRATTVGIYALEEMSKKGYALDMNTGRNLTGAQKVQMKLGIKAFPITPKLDSRAFTPFLGSLSEKWLMVRWGFPFILLYLII